MGYLVEKKVASGFYYHYMNNFEFFNNTRILFGDGQIKALSAQLPAGARVLVIYGGGSIKKNGVFEQVSAALAGFSWQEFGGIEANPHFETCMRAVELVRRESVDFLLAVGGGSVIDATKFIAAAAVYQGDPWGNRQHFRRIGEDGAADRLCADAGGHRFGNEPHRSDHAQCNKGQTVL